MATNAVMVRSGTQFQKGIFFPQFGLLYGIVGLFEAALEKIRWPDCFRLSMLREPCAWALLQAAASALFNAGTAAIRPR